MKKTFISLFSIAVLGLSLPSCLGDGGEQSYEVNREFGVIGTGLTSTNVPITQASMSNGLIITGGDVSNYSSGDVVLVTYKANLNNFISSTTVQVDYANIEDDDVFKVANQKSVHIEESVGNNDATAETSFTGITTQYGHRSEFFSNRWLVSVSANLKKDQEITGIELYYDKEKQTLTDGTLPDDAIILDVKLLKTASTSGTTETSVKSKSVALNLTSLRENDPKTMKHPSSEKTLYIWLRYPKYNVSTQKYETGVIIQNALGITYYPDSTTN